MCVACTLGYFAPLLLHGLAGGVPIVDAVVGFTEHKEKRRESRKGKRVLRDVPKIIFEGAYSKTGGKGNWLQQVTSDVNKYLVGKKVAQKTVSKELRIRGIVEQSTSYRKKNS